MVGQSLQSCPLSPAKLPVQSKAHPYPCSGCSGEGGGDWWRPDRPARVSAIDEACTRGAGGRAARSRRGPRSGAITFIALLIILGTAANCREAETGSSSPSPKGDEAPISRPRRETQEPEQGGHLVTGGPRLRVAAQSSRTRVTLETADFSGTLLGKHSSRITADSPRKAGGTITSSEDVDTNADAGRIKDVLHGRIDPNSAVSLTLNENSNRTPEYTDELSSRRVSLLEPQAEIPIERIEGEEEVAGVKDSSASTESRHLLFPVTDTGELERSEPVFAGSLSKSVTATIESEPEEVERTSSGEKWLASLAALTLIIVVSGFSRGNGPRRRLRVDDELDEQGPGTGSSADQAPGHSSRGARSFVVRPAK
jgi:hypothetical protein